MTKSQKLYKAISENVVLAEDFNECDVFCPDEDVLNVVCEAENLDIDIDSKCLASAKVQDNKISGTAVCGQKFVLYVFELVALKLD